MKKILIVFLMSLVAIFAAGQFDAELAEALRKKDLIKNDGEK